MRDSYPLAAFATRTKVGARLPTSTRKAGLDTLTEANPDLTDSANQLGHNGGGDRITTRERGYATPPSYSRRPPPHPTTKSTKHYKSGGVLGPGQSAIAGRWGQASFREARLSEPQRKESTSRLMRVFVLSVSKSWMRVCFESLTSSFFAVIVKEN